MPTLDEFLTSPEYAPLSSGKNELKISNKQRKQAIEQYDRGVLDELQSTMRATTPVGQYFETDSRYDQGMPSSMLDDIGEYRGQVQTTGHKWLSGLSKFGITAATTFLDGTIGTVWGLAELATGGSFINNTFSNWMADIGEWQEKALPNYYTREELESPWYTNIGTANFLADKFVKNIGFTVGAVYSGMAWSGLAGALLRTSKTANNIAKGVANKMFEGNMDKAMKALKSGDPKALRMLEKELLADATKLKYKNWTQQVIGSVAGAQGESRIEAIHGARAFEDKHLPQIEGKWQDENFLAQKRQEAIENVGLDAQTMYENPELAESLIQDYLAVQKSEEIDKLREMTDALRNTTFFMNLGALSVSNAIQFRNAFSSGYKSSAKTMQAVRPKEGGLPMQIERIKPKGFLEKTGHVAGKTAKYSGNVLTEAFEEMTQQVIEKTGDEYYSRKLDPENSDTMADYFKEFFTTYADVATDPNQWEEAFIGGLTGGMGMVRVGKSGVGWSGGIYEDVVSDNAARKYTDEMISKWNEVVASDRFKNVYHHAMTGVSLQKDAEMFAEQQDVLNYKNTEHDFFVNDVMYAIQAERFDELVAFYESLGRDVNPEEMKQMFKVTKDKDGKDIAEDEQQGMFDNMEDKDIREYFAERGRKLKDKAKRIKELYDAIDIKFSQNINPNVKGILLRYMSTIDNVEERKQAIKDKLGKSGLPLETIAKLEQHVANIIETDGKATEKTAALYDELETELSIFDKKNPNKIDNVKELVKDYLALSLRRMKYVNLYAKAVTEKGQGELNDYINSLNEEVETLNKGIQDNAELLNKIKRVRNESLKNVLEQTMLTEEIQREDGVKGTANFRGDIEVTVDIANKDAEPTPEVRRYTVLGMDEKTGGIWARETSDKNKKEVLFNALSKDENTGTVGSGGTNIISWRNMKVVKTAQEHRQELFENSVREVYKETLNRATHNVKVASEKLEKILKVQKIIEERLDAILKNKSGKTRIVFKEDSSTNLSKKELENIIKEGKINIDTLNKSAVVVSVVELETIRKAIIELKEKAIEDSERFNEEKERIEEQVRNTTLEGTEDILIGYVQQGEQMDKLIKSLELSEKLINDKIRKIESYLKGLITRLRNLKKDKNNLLRGSVYTENALKHVSDKLSKYFDQEVIDEIDEQFLDVEAIERLVEDIAYVESLQEKGELKKELYLKDLEQVKNDLEEVKKSLENVKTKVKEYSNLLNRLSDTYYNSEVFFFDDKKGANTKVNDDSRTEETELTSGYELSQIEPFTNEVHNLRRTTLAHDTYIRLFEAGDDTHEPELFFQEFIDNEHDKYNKYKLHALSIGNFVNQYRGDLTPSQLAELEKDARDYPNGIITVVVNAKSNNAYKQPSIINKEDNKQSLVYTKINGVRRENGKPVNERFASGDKLVDLKVRQKKASKTELEVQQEFEKISEEYENKVLKPILDSNEGLYLEITGATPGVLNLDKDNYQPINPKEVVNSKTGAGIELIIGTGNTSDNGQFLQKGIVYMKLNGAYLKLNRNTLNDSDVNKVVDLLSFAMTKETVSETFELQNLINEITYFQNEKSGRTQEGQSKSFRLFVTSMGTASNAKVTGVAFGDNGYISKKELLNPNENQDKINQFKAFLASKFYNINKKDLESKAKYTISNIELQKDKSGVVAGGTITQQEYNGNYTQYILDNDNSRVYSIAKPKKTTREENIKEPVKLSRSLKFKIKNSVEKEAVANSSASQENQTSFEVLRVFGEDDVAESKYVEKSTLAGKGSEITLDHLKNNLDEVFKFEIGGETHIFKYEDGKVTHIEGNKDVINKLFDINNTKIKETLVKLNELTKSKNLDYKLSLVNEESTTKAEKESNEIIEKTVEAVSQEVNDDFLAESGIDINTLDKNDLIDPNVADIDSEIPFRVSRTQDKTDFITQQELDKFKQILPNTILKIVELGGNIEGAFAASKISAKVLVSPTAEKGTLFHEAYHVIQKYFTTPKERKRLYDAVRKELGNRTVTTQEGKELIQVKGKDMTDSQAEEFLAEEFRTFMLVGKDNYNFPKGEPIKKNIFQRLWEIVKRLLLPKSHWNANNIVESFIEISESNYEITPDKLTGETETKFRVGELNDRVANVAVKNINHVFFSILNNDSKFETKYSDFSKYASELYKRVYTLYYNAAKNNNDKTAFIIAKNWKPLVQHHINYLKQYNIQVDASEVFKDDESNNTKDTNNFAETNKVNIKEFLPTPLKLLIASIPEMYREKNGEVNFKRDLGLIQTVDYGRIMNTLFKNLANLSTINQAVDVLKELGKTTNPEVSTLLDKLGITETAFESTITKEQFDLQTAFFVSFMNTSNDYITTSINEAGQIYSISNLEDTQNRKVRDLWRSTLKANIDSGVNRGLYITEGDKIYINLNAIIKIGNNSNTVKKFNPENLTADLAVKYLEYLGIYLSPNINTTTHKALLISAVQYIYKEGISTIKEDKLLIDDILNPDVIKANKEIKQLVELEAKMNPLITDLQIVVSGGQTEYSIMQVNRLSKVVDELNMDTLPEHLVSYSSETETGNIGTFGSIWIEATQAKVKPVKIEKIILRNFGEDGSDKTDISELGTSDFMRVELNSVLEGRFPFLRSSERKIEYGFNFGKNYVELRHKVNIESMLKDYLKGEVMYALALQTDPKSKRLLKRSKVQGLSYFREILPGLNSTVSKKKTLEGLSLEEAAEKLIKEHETEINAKIKQHVIDVNTRLKNDLIENRILEVTETGGKFLGLNVQVGEKILGAKVYDAKKYSTLEQIDKILDTFNYYYLQSTIEQTKLITGDMLVYYKEGKRTSDFHKRTTTFASTIAKSIVNTNFNSLLEKFYPRFDGFKHQDNYKDSVFADQKETSKYLEMYKKVLGDVYAKAYEDMSVNDAQGLAFADGYRTLAVRNNDWSHAKEKSWQYMMQRFAEHLVENNKLTKKEYKDYFKTDYVKGNYTYNGENLSVENLIPLNNLKYQGTGLIRNEDLAKFNAVQITKTSIALINPLDYLDNPEMIDFILAGMKNGMDMIFPESAKKGEIVGNDGGEIAKLRKDDKLNPKFNIEEISWGDFAKQMNIDPEGKEKVTMSTQMRRVQFIDTHNNGIAKPEFKHLEPIYNEYNDLQKLVVEKAIDKFVRDLGLSESTANEYKLIKDDKFFDTLIEQFDQRQMPFNVKESLEAIMNSSLKVFDSAPTKIQIVNALQGMIRARIVSMKVNGDMLVQEASNTIVSGDKSLKFYRLLDANGNETNDINKAVTVGAAEVIIPLPRTWIKFIDSKFPGTTFEDRLAAFNEAIADKSSDTYKNLAHALKFSANRVPTQHLNSVEAFEIVKFSHPLGGSKIFLPYEIVAKSGSDFDIDKLTSYFNNVKFDKDGMPVQIKYLTEKSTLEEKAISVFNSNDVLADLLYKRTKDLDKVLEFFNNVKKNIVEQLKLKRELLDSEDIKSTYEDIEALNNYFEKRMEGKSAKEKKDIELERDTDPELTALYMKIGSYIGAINQILQENNEIKKNILTQIKEVIKDIPVQQLNSRAAVENRLNELSMQVTLDKNNFGTLIKPNNSDIIKKQAKKTRNLDEKVKIHEQLEFPYNSKIADSQWNATKLVGSGALNVVSHAATQKYPIRGDKSIVKILFKNYKGITGDLFMGHEKDQNGGIISDNNGAVLTGAVDAGKEVNPTIFQINLTMQSNNAYFFLMRMGAAQEKPLSFEFLTEFFTSPVILEYERLKKINESKYLEANNLNKSKSEIIKSLITVPENTKLLHELFGEYTKAQSTNAKRIAKENLIKRLNYVESTYGYLNENDFNRNDKKAAVLEYYLYYQELGKILSMFQSTTRPDAGLPKDYVTVKLEDLEYKRLLKLDIFKKEDIERMMKDSYIGAYKKAHDKSMQFFKDNFLVEKDKRLNDFIWGEKGVMQTYLNPTLAKSKKDLVEIAYKLQNATLAYILHHVPGTVQQNYEKYFMGENSIPKQLQRMKAKLPNNLAIRELIAMVNEYDKRTQDNRENDFIKFFNKKLTIQESNTVTNGIKEMLESNDAQVSTFAQSLIFFSIMQSGVQRSPFSYFELLPGKVYTELLNKHFETFSKSSQNILTESAKGEIIANLAYDSSIVPRTSQYRYTYTGQRESKIDDNGNLHVYMYDQNAQYPFLAVNADAVNAGKAESLREDKQKVPKKLLLFKRVTQEGKEVIYQPMYIKGDGMRFFEIQKNVNTPSILKANRNKNVAPLLIDKVGNLEFVAPIEMRVETQQQTTQQPATQGKKLESNKKDVSLNEKSKDSNNKC